LKPVSLVELSVQTRLIPVVEAGVAVSPVGAAAATGVLTAKSAAPAQSA
jgi:hypothetical protein